VEPGNDFSETGRRNNCGRKMKKEDLDAGNVFNHNNNTQISLINIRINT
jgi:hypothetical protein